MESRTGGGSGWVAFAGIMFVIAGCANVIWGIGAIADKAYLSDNGVLFASLGFWGWVAVIWGAIVLYGSYLLLTGSPSGREVGIVLAIISAVFWFIALPVLPIFGLTAILIDSLIIFGLCSASASTAG
ncbi:MAG TPA: hypothetical protein VH476_06910 [Solirubrobacterales bacterium]|jgi:hypothetical protein